MFSLIKQVFVVLLSFSEYLSTKCLFLNDEPCMVRPALIDMNPIELKNYPFMISLINVLEVTMSYLQKYVFQKKQRTYMLKHLIR